MKLSLTPAVPPPPRKSTTEPLAPLDPAKTVRRPTFRRRNRPGGDTRDEIWAATSKDGVYQFDRVEDTGTPWVVMHLPSNIELGAFGSLARARAAVAAPGWTERELERRRREIAQARLAWKTA